MVDLSILGSTGSIGTQTLDVVRQFPHTFRVLGLTAGNNIELLASQIREFSPIAVSIKNKQDKLLLQRLIGKMKVDIYDGDYGNCQVTSIKNVDKVVIATSGLAGILPTLAAIENHKTVALATKEVLVAAGDLVMKKAREAKVDILPIDSEHSAIFQCLEGKKTTEISRIYLTCSGGPFRGWKSDQLKDVTVAQALNHPNWKMGKKISIDSATLMNKGFEVIEAMHLFGIPLEKISVIIHPQSVIHSLVEFVDGSLLAQIGPSDMRLPIQYALLYPKPRQANLFKRFSFADYPNLTFEQPDLKTFPCLSLALEAVQKGGSYPAVLTAANDIAVDAFLNGNLKFCQIPKVIEKTLLKQRKVPVSSVEAVLAVDQWARVTARQNLLEKNLGQRKAQPD